jgi:flagellar protein FlgJ
MSEIGDATAAYNATRVLPTFAPGMDGTRIRKVATELEGVFLGQMLKPMFEEMNAAPPFGGGPAEDMWQSLMVDEYGKAIAQTGGIGIAKMVMDQMLKAQEEARP